MRLTTFTDYSLRTLLHIGMNRDRLVTIQEIAEEHAISKNHLMKVVHQLALAGYVETIRGRNGGLRLQREPSEINIGEVVRYTENDFYMAECFDPASNTCPLSANCRLKKTLTSATSAYLAVLEGQTLETLLGGAENRKVETPIKIHRKVAA